MSRTIPKKTLESEIEKYLRVKVSQAGGVTEKVTVLGSRGFFDRLVLLPGGNIIFAEIKKPRGSVTSVHQRARHELYRHLGATVTIIKTFADVDLLVDQAANGSVQKSA